jgi:hypothetical protein
MAYGRQASLHGPQPVLVVLTNWKRPQNIPGILEALEQQTVKAPVLLVDNAPDPKPAGDPVDPLRARFLDVWRFTENHGPPCRLAPAMVYHDYRYYLFLDDDYLPGRCCVENMLANARSLRDRFSTIGWLGRRFKQESGALLYHYGEWRKHVVDPHGHLATPSRVDMTIRGHLVQACHVPHALSFKWKLMGEHRASLATSLGRHDDFLLCQGIQTATRLPSYLAAAMAGGSEGARVWKELPTEDDRDVAARHRPGHQEERTACIRAAARMGWRSLVSATATRNP